MSFDSKKTILLEKTYLYVRASLGFQLEGTSTEKIPTNNGFYRFFVDNLQKAIGNSYVNILYDSQDLTLQCFCSDLYMDELMSSDSSAIEDVVAELKKNTTTIIEFENGVSSALESNHQDNIALNAKLEEFEAGVSSAFASNHLDNVAILESSNSISDLLLKNFIPSRFSDGPNISFGNSANKNFIRYDLNVSNCVKYSDIFFWHFFENVYNNPASSTITFLFRVGDFDFLSGSMNRLNISVACKYIDSNGNLTSRCIQSYSLDSGYLRCDFPSVDILLSYDIWISSDKQFFDKLIFYLGDDKYNFSSFSSNRLTLYPFDSFSSSLNQNFNYDFNGGFLDFKFYSNIALDWLKGWTYTFLTDMGKFSFTGDELGLIYDTKDTTLCVCSTLPEIKSTFSVKKLLGVRVSKSGSSF